MKKLLLLNGPNLNLLGEREPDVYGHTTLADIEHTVGALCTEAHWSFEACQSNAEHELINTIHQAKDAVDAIVINPAGFTHTSIALRDALLGVDIPFVEIHLSNTHARESFRHTSYFSDVAVGVIMGFGTLGYTLATQAVIAHIEQLNN